MAKSSNPKSINSSKRQSTFSILPIAVTSIIFAVIAILVARKYGGSYLEKGKGDVNVHQKVVETPQTRSSHELDLLIEYFHSSILSPKSVNITLARNILSTASTLPASTLRQLLRAPIKMETLPSIPLLHHCLNVYVRLENKWNVKRDLASLVETLVSMGADVNQKFGNDPPLLFKALKLRELRLSRTIANAGAIDDSTGVALRETLTVPCEPVPLAKLLLATSTFANKIAAKRGQAMDSKALLATIAGANLHGQKASVGGLDLQHLSSTYLNIFDRIVSLDEPQNHGVTLLELIKVLEEASFPTLRALLNKKSHPQHPDDADVVDFANLISTPNPVTFRNMFHFLAHSGASLLVDEINSLVSQYLMTLKQTHGSQINTAFDKENQEDNKKHGQTKEEELLRSAIKRALVEKDIRGLTPLDYSCIRFPSPSLLHTAFIKLCESIDYHPDVLHQDTCRHLGDSGGKKSPMHALAGENVGGVHGNIGTDSAEDTGGWSVPSKDQIETLRSLGNGPHHNVRGDDSDRDSDNKGVTSDTDEADNHKVRNDASHSTYPTDRCDIEEFHGTLPSHTDFLSILYRGRPVIFRGGALGGVIRKWLKKDTFLQRHGRQFVEVASIPYASSFGVDSKRKSLLEVANVASSLPNELEASSLSLSVLSSHVEQNYAFTTVLQDKLKEDCPPPPFLLPTSAESDSPSTSPLTTPSHKVTYEMQFYLGPAGSGAPPHFHGNAVNTLAYGEKRWFLFPPTSAFYTTTPAISFVASDERVNASLQCTQRAGDIIFVPSLWGHAVLNVKQVRFDYFSYFSKKNM